MKKYERDWKVLRVLSTVLLGEPPAIEVKIISIPLAQGMKSLLTPGEKKMLGDTQNRGKGGIFDADILANSKLFSKST